MNYLQASPKAQWALSWACSIAQEEPANIESCPSNEVNEVLRLHFPNRKLYLKVGPALDREYERLKWLDGRLPAPRAIGFIVGGSEGALLTSEVEGQSLAELAAVLPPQEIISRLARVLRMLHADSTSGWPFGGAGVLLHGDACLPNFLFDASRFTAYIDVGDMALGEPEVDLSAAVWSLQYNLGPGHGAAFLREYGLPDVSEEYVEMLRLRYDE